MDGAVRGLTGAYNWTNPGAISHNEVRALRCTTHPSYQVRGDYTPYTPPILTLYTPYTTPIHPLYTPYTLI